MWNKIKEMFFVEPKTEILLKNLNAWVESRSKNILSSSKEKLHKISIDMLSILNAINNAAIDLENAKISIKEHIEPRVKSIVLSNRQHYLQRLAIFTDRAKTMIEQEKPDLQQELDTFASTTNKQYYKAGHLFSKETDVIVKLFKELGVYSMEAAVETTRVANLNRLHMLLNNIKTASDDFLRSKKQLADKKDKLKITCASLTHIISELENSKEKSAYNNLKNESLKTINQQKIAENNIRTSFGIFERALRKYEYTALEHKPLIKEYLSDSLSALIRDKGLIIVSVLEKLKDAVPTMSLKHSEKINESITLLSQEKLHLMREKYKEYSHQYKTIILELEGFTILHEIEVAQAKLLLAKKELEEINTRQIDKQTINKEEMVTLIKELFGVHVVLT